MVSFRLLGFSISFWWGLRKRKGLGRNTTRGLRMANIDIEGKLEINQAIVKLLIQAIREVVKDEKIIKKIEKRHYLLCNEFADEFAEDDSNFE